MADQYHYDKDGRYTGKTSDKPPSDGSGCGALILIAIIIFAISKCTGNDSSRSDQPAPAVQEILPTEPETTLVPQPEHELAPAPFSEPDLSQQEPRPSTTQEPESSEPPAATTSGEWVVPTED
jgi:hypothetical protein